MRGLWQVTYVLLSVGLLAKTVSAAEIPDLKNYLETQIVPLNDALEEQAQKETGETIQHSFWFLRRSGIRLRPNVTLTAGIAQVGIVPEIEVIWERELPPGWVLPKVKYLPAFSYLAPLTRPK
jgi:hypothetical protein